MKLVFFEESLSLLIRQSHRGGMFIEKFNPKPHEHTGGEIMLLRKIEPELISYKHI